MLVVTIDYLCDYNIEWDYNIVCDHNIEHPKIKKKNSEKLELRLLKLQAAMQKSYWNLFNSNMQLQVLIVTFMVLSGTILKIKTCKKISIG